MLAVLSPSTVMPAIVLNEARSRATQSRRPRAAPQHKTVRSPPYVRHKSRHLGTAAPHWLLVLGCGRVSPERFERYAAPAYTHMHLCI